jgi:hypothetical protein
MRRNVNPKSKVRGPRQNLRKQNGMARRSSATIPHPPPINNYEVTHNKTLRFTTNANVSQAITFYDLLDTILVSATAVLPYDLFFAVKVRKVKVWSMPAIGSSNSITVIFDGIQAGFVGDRKVHQDSSMGVEPAYLSVSPAKDSLASKFQIAANTTAFFIEAPAGSIIDVDLTFRSDVLGNAVSSQAASVGAAVGAIGYRGLDGLAIATTKFTPPTSFNNI